MKCFDKKWGSLNRGTCRGMSVFCIVVFLFSGCTNIEDKNNLELEKNYSGLTDQNIEWLNQVNSGSPLIAYYHPFALMLFENEWYLARDEIEKNLYDLDIEKRIVRAVYEHRSSQIFEIGEYILSDRAVWTYLTAYTRYDDQWLRQLEVLYKKEDISSEAAKSVVRASDIERSWADSVASKDTEQLVETLFWENARYVNLAYGHYTNSYEELFEVYGFAEIPDAELSIQVMDMYVVRDDVIYIIGQYNTGLGQGYYALIHTKDDQNTWKNILDTNY